MSILLGIMAAFGVSYAVVGIAAKWQRWDARRRIERRIDQLRLR